MAQSWRKAETALDISRSGRAYAIGGGQRRRSRGRTVAVMARWPFLIEMIAAGRLAFILVKASATVWPKRETG